VVFGAVPVKIKNFVLVGGAIVLPVVAFTVWYVIAADYDYSALSGTYVFREKGETCVLYLRLDQTFSQEINRSGQIQKSQGHWRRIGEGGVSFTNEFMRLPGEEFGESGEVYGEFDKTLGIFPKLALSSSPNGPMLRRRLLH
jgi:hypothetical protein